jgi:hypothetical protein
MKTFIAALSALGLFSAFKSFRSRYAVGIYYIDKLEEVQEQIRKATGPFDINDLKPENYDNAMDVRGTPTHLCPCGCNIWNVKVIFEDFEVATYFLDMECANCGTMATAPTLLDKEKME